MAATKRQRGRDLMIFIKYGSGTYKAIAFAKSCSFAMNAQTERVVDKDTGTAGFEEFLSSEWTMDSNSVMAADGADADAAIDALQVGTEVLVQWGTTPNANPNGVDAAGGAWTAPTTGWEGKALISSVSIQAPAEGKAELSISFKGSGQLKKIGTAGTGK